MTLAANIVADGAAILADLGTAVTFDPTGTPVSIKGIFNAPGAPVPSFDGTFELSGPALVILASDHSPARGDSVQVGATTYTIADPPQVSGFGWLVLSLREQ